MKNLLANGNKDTDLLENGLEDMVCARVCVCVATELRLYVFSLLSISVAQGKPEHLEK